MTTKVTVSVPDYIPLVRVKIKEPPVYAQKNVELSETILKGGESQDFHIWGDRILEVKEDHD